MTTPRNLNTITEMGNPIKIILVLLYLTVALAACNGDLKSDELEMTEKFSDPAFEEVIEGSYLYSECSPDIDDPDFRGIQLNAPAVVAYVPGRSNPLNGAFAPIVVCGAFVFDYTTLGLNGDFADSIVIVAVDEKSRNSFRGTMPGVENEVPMPEGIESDSSEEDFSEDIIGGFFNPNLAVILGLPEREADYVVYALLGPFESNRVRISVKEPVQ